MAETIRFYRTFNIETPASTTGVFRYRDLGPGLGAYLERWDRSAPAWITDFAALSRYVSNGEDGAEPITAKTALEWIGGVGAFKRLREVLGL